MAILTLAEKLLGPVSTVHVCLKRIKLLTKARISYIAPYS